MTQQLETFYKTDSSDKDLSTQITEYLRNHPRYTLFDLHIKDDFSMAIAVFNIDKKTTWLVEDFT